MKTGQAKAERKEIMKKEVYNTRPSNEIVRYVDIDCNIRPMTEVELQYFELIMAVARTFPNETRHQTALKYIREAEEQATSEGAKVAPCRLKQFVKFRILLWPFAVSLEILLLIIAWILVYATEWTGVLMFARGTRKIHDWAVEKLPDRSWYFGT